MIGWVRMAFLAYLLNPEGSLFSTSSALYNTIFHLGEAFVHH